MSSRPAQRVTIFALTGLLASACSVAQPRHGGLAADGVTVDGAVAASTELGAEGSADSSTGTTASAGATGGGGSSVSGPGGGSTAGTGGAVATTTGGGTRGASSRTGSAGAGTGPKTPGVTKDEITISVIAGFSGPLAAMVEKAYQGMQTWQEDVNEAGGIHGRKIRFEKIDHKETADGGIGACKIAVSNNSYVAMVPEGIEANVTATSCLDAAGVPTLVFAGAVDPRWRMAFTDAITTSDAGRTMASYVRSVLGAASKKVGVIYVNQLAYKALADTLVPEAKRLGLPVAPSEPVEPNQASFTAQLARLQSARVEVLVISATAESIGILRDAQAMGFEPMVFGWGMTFDFITAAGRGLFDGVRGLRVNATVDTPAYERYAARMEARGRGHDRSLDTEAFEAYGHVVILGEMLKKAGPSPTRASFVSGAETIRGFDSGVFPPVTWGPGDHIGTQAAFPALCCNSDYTWKFQGPSRSRF